MSILQTAERVSQRNPSDNYVFQRSILAYYECAKLVSGRVLEIGTGSGYGIEVISKSCDQFVTIDKHTLNDPELTSGKFSNVEFLTMTIPPFKGIADESFDFVISFQVIEHIEDDNAFVKEIHRVLKKGGKFIVTTPNKKMSITRNPWHVREYTIDELATLLGKCFSKVQKKGVFGNQTVMTYYEANKKSVERITRFDIFNLQYRLPRVLLQIPYDILNRMNRKKLATSGDSKSADIRMEDYTVREAAEGCFDLFYVAEK